jgi:choline kinase
MNILIPLAGRGERFVNGGYQTPKPLIEINGKTLIECAVETLDLEGTYIFIVNQKHCDHYDLHSLLNRLSPNCHIVITDTITEGPACSALLAKQFITQDELVIANCDQIMDWESQLFVNTARFYDGCVVTYTENTPKNSYARLGPKGLVTEIREKQVISNISLNGIHYWKDGLKFIQSARDMINADERYNNEFYIGPTYNYLINQGGRVGIHHIPNQQHHAVGVPEDLNRYLHHSK